MSNTIVRLLINKNKRNIFSKYKKMVDTEKDYATYQVGCAFRPFNDTPLV